VTFFVFVAGLSLGVVLGALMLIRLVQIGTIHVHPSARPLPPMVAEEEYEVVDPTVAHAAWEDQQEQDRKVAKEQEAYYDRLVHAAMQTARTTRERGGGFTDPVADLMDRT
jgi:hypothetical protein